MEEKKESLRTKVTEQEVLLEDKSRENKNLHQELSRVTAVLDAKLNEIAGLREALNDNQKQLKMRESERDLLAVMLNEAENAQRKRDRVLEPEKYKTQKPWNYRVGPGPDLVLKIDEVPTLHALLDGVPIGLAVLSKEGMILFANRQLLLMTDYYLLDLERKEVCCLFEQHKGNSALIKNLLAATGMLEARIKRKDRTGILCGVTLSRMTASPEGRLMLGVIDLTEVRSPLNFD